MPLLRIDQVSKKSGGLKALSEVSLELQKGQIQGLIGPNGSGTLVVGRTCNRHEPEGNCRVNELC